MTDIDTPHGEPIPLTHLAPVVDVPPSQVVLWVREGLIAAGPPRGKAARLVEPAEVARVQRVAAIARAVGLPPTVLLRLIAAGTAELRTDGRVVLDPPAAAVTGDPAELAGAAA